MKKPGLLIIILCTVCLVLSGCGFFDSEYMVVEDYAPTIQSDSIPEEKNKVHNISSLKQAISTIIINGETEGKIVFDQAYDGDPVTDMSKACWQVRTQDALCAYCVADISYELSKIVTYYEAKLNIGYTDYVENAGSIVELAFSTGIEAVIRQTLEDGDTRVVMLVGHSSYSAEDVVNLVGDVYRKDPAVAPREPSVSVNMYSGSNMQRLYEVNMRYGVAAEELKLRKAKLRDFSPFDEAELESLDDAERALLAYEYICANTVLDASDLRNTIYDALIGGNAGSEGIALAYIELCRQLDVECMVVYGQHDWQSHCWNIINADGVYYHVDAGMDEARRDFRGFMKTDEDFWATYRWDMSSYPACMPLPENSEEFADVQEEIYAPEDDENIAGKTMEDENDNSPGEKDMLPESGPDFEQKAVQTSDNSGPALFSEQNNGDEASFSAEENI